MVLRKLWPAALLMLTLAGCGDSGPSDSANPASPISPSFAAESAVPSATGNPSSGPGRTTSGGPASPTPASSFGGLEMAKSGGIAGIAESVSIKPDGGWTKMDGRTVTKTGKLTTAQQAKLRQMTADPRLATEAGRKIQPGRCADAFNYLLHVNFQLIRYQQCGAADKPQLTMAIIDYVEVITS
jgi:hypothetical protein